MNRSRRGRRADRDGVRAVDLGRLLNLVSGRKGTVTGIVKVHFAGARARKVNPPAIERAAGRILVQCHDDFVPRRRVGARRVGTAGAPRARIIPANSSRKNRFAPVVRSSSILELIR